MRCKYVNNKKREKGELKYVHTYTYIHISPKEINMKLVCSGILKQKENDKLLLRPILKILD